MHLHLQFPDSLAQHHLLHEPQCRIKLPLWTLSMKVQPGL